MSMIKFPKWVVKMINTHMANFFWNDQENNHKYHLSNWQSLTQRKEKGGGGRDPRLKKSEPLPSGILGSKIL
jgi:hypothetical protein